MLPSIKTINFSKLHNNCFCTSDDLDSWLGMAATPKAACCLAGLVWDGSWLTRPLPLWLCSRVWHLAHCPLRTSQHLLLFGTSGMKQRINDSMMILHLGRKNSMNQCRLGAELAGKQLCREGPEGSGGQEVDDELAINP